MLLRSEVSELGVGKIYSVQFQRDFKSQGKIELSYMSKAGGL